MIDEQDLRELLHRRASAIPMIAVDPGKATRRARRRLLANGAVAVIVAAVIGVAMFDGIHAIRTAPVPGHRTPAPGVLRTSDEVLSFTGSADAPGDLVAVDPQTREARVLVPDLEAVYAASWSADGRWVAYETPAPEGRGLWVADASHEPRLVATGGDPDLFAALGLGSVAWSPTGAELAAIDGSTLIAIDPATGETTELASIDADQERNALLTPTPVWSPDGTRIVYGGRNGALSSVDVRSGARSLLVHLPGEEFESSDELLWSPDGAHLALLTHANPTGAGRLSLMDADGSNLRVVADDYDPLGVAWSPDGTRLAFGEGDQPEGAVRIRVAPVDGTRSPVVGSVPFAGCAFPYRCDLTWSSDGSQIAFRKLGGAITAFAPDGPGGAEPLDDLTYRSWEDGGYSCECT
jgi:dipeptidyl aminopeptidase/acylaminoacyl peptidase